MKDLRNGRFLATESVAGKDKIPGKGSMSF